MLYRKIVSDVSSFVMQCRACDQNVLYGDACVTGVANRRVRPIKKVAMCEAGMTTPQSGQGHLAYPVWLVTCDPCSKFSFDRIHMCSMMLVPFALKVLGEFDFYHMNSVPLGHRFHNWIRSHCSLLCEDIRTFISCNTVMTWNPKKGHMLALIEI